MSSYRRSLVGSGIFVFVLIVAVAIGALVGVDFQEDPVSADVASGAASEQPTATPDLPASYRVTYTLKTQHAVGGVRVTYNNGTGGIQHDIAAAFGPWIQTFEMFPGAHAYVTATIPHDSRPEAVIGCMLTVDGEVVVSQVTRGPSGSVTCSTLVGVGLR